MSDGSCAVCSALPSAEPPRIHYPTPVREDEWAHHDRIQGAFIGAALGDGIGGLVQRGEGVLPRSGPGWLATAGATQLGLFAAEALIRMTIRVAAKGIGPAWGVIRHGLDRWMITQSRPPHRIFPGDDELWPDGWLVRQHGLHRRVAGFAATIAASHSTRDRAEGLMERRVPAHPVNRSSGAGALVRCWPAGVAYDRGRALVVGAIAGAYTHGHPEAYLASAALARIVAGLIDGEDPNEAAALATEELAAWPESEKTREALAAARAIGATTSSRSLAAGRFYGSLGDEPETCILRAAAAAGPAAGVVAGTIVGARYGASALASDWRTAPDTLPVMEEIAQAASVAHRAWVMGRRLPGWDYLGGPGPEEHPACRLLGPRFPGW